MDESAQRLLSNIREHVRALVNYLPAEQEWPDAIADCQELERLLADWRRNLQREAADMDRVDEPDGVERVSDFDKRAGRPVLVGDRYELVPVRENRYTYNDPAILVTVADQLGVDLVSAVLALLRPVAAGGREGAPLDLRWKVSYLRAFAQSHGFEFDEAKGAVSNDDGSDGPPIAVDKVTKTTKPVPITRDDE